MINLCAGLGERMGFPKQDLDIDGVNILEITDTLYDHVVHVVRHKPKVPVDYVECESTGTLHSLYCAYATPPYLVKNCDNFIYPLSRPAVKTTVWIGKPRSPWGVIRRVTDGYIMEEKPLLDIWVSTGHYYFEQVKIDDPFNKDIETTLLTRPFEVAKVMDWIGIDTRKDIKLASQFFRKYYY